MKGKTFVTAIILGAWMSLGLATAAEPPASGVTGQAVLGALNIYLDGFHFHNGDMGRQVEAHHFCGEAGEGVFQCVIFDGAGPSAHLMGVEYVITEDLFKTLSEDEKRLWHSHGYEVKSGQLVAPGLPPDEELALMGTLVATYGKTWHTWHLELPDNKLPLGIPALMMGFTQDGQANPEMVSARDKHFGISSQEKVKNRAGIAKPNLVPGADAWEKGEVVQLGPVRKEKTLGWQK
jgi:hypothetical protein